MKKKCFKLFFQYSIIKLATNFTMFILNNFNQSLKCKTVKCLLHTMHVYTRMHTHTNTFIHIYTQNIDTVSSFFVSSRFVNRCKIFASEHGKYVKLKHILKWKVDIFAVFHGMEGTKFPLQHFNYPRFRNQI